MVGTLRQEIMAALLKERLSARELSQLLHITEKEVHGHLDHVQRTAGTRGLTLCQEPPQCLDCGFTFHDRRRPRPPGKCPACRGSHIRSARFFLA